MSRWSYLIPRIIITGLLLTAIWLGRDPLIRGLMISQVQNSIGAKAEIGQVRSSFSNGKLFLEGLKIADPRDPMRNLIQADLAYLNFDLDHLLRREFVIDGGETSQVMFGVPRTDSGAIDESDDLNKFSSLAAAPGQPDLNQRDFESEVKQIGNAWIDKIEPGQSVDSVAKFEIEIVAAAARKSWDKISDYRTHIAQLNPAILQLRAALGQNGGLHNPLRDDLREKAKKELAKLENEATAVRANLIDMQRLVSEQIQSLYTAKIRDEQKLRQLTWSNQFESDAITQLLLHETQGKLVDDVVSWFRWFRAAIPDPTTDLCPKSQRGIDVAFKGVASRPKFLIKELELKGEGRLANQHLNFVGVAYNLSNQPRLLDQPASFELKALGNQQLIVNCSVDRRADQPVDRLQIQCPNLMIDSRQLGNQDSLLVTMGTGGRMHAEVNLQVEGDRLSGTMVFHHSGISFHVDKLHELAGGKDTRLRINQELLKVSQFKTSIDLSGSLENYSFEFESDLGAQFSATVDQIVRSENEQKTIRYKERLNEILKIETSHLNDVISAEISELAGQLQHENMLIAELKEKIDTKKEDSSLPRLR